MGSFMKLTVSHQLKVQHGRQEVAGPQWKLAFHLGDSEHEQEMAEDRASHQGKSKPRAACPFAEMLKGYRIKRVWGLIHGQELKKYLWNGPMTPSGSEEWCVRDRSPREMGPRRGTKSHIYHAECRPRWQLTGKYQ